MDGDLDKDLVELALDAVRSKSWWVVDGPTVSCDHCGASTDLVGDESPEAAFGRIAPHNPTCILGHLSRYGRAYRQLTTQTGEEDAAAAPRSASPPETPAVEEVPQEPEPLAIATNEESGSDSPLWAVDRIDPGLAELVRRIEAAETAAPDDEGGDPDDAPAEDLATPPDDDADGNDSGDAPTEGPATAPASAAPDVEPHETVTAGPEALGPTRPAAKHPLRTSLKRD